MRCKVVCRNNISKIKLKWMHEVKIGCPPKQHINKMCHYSESAMWINHKTRKPHAKL